MNKRISVKILSLLLSIALILSCVPLAFAEENKTFSIATINDIHYYPECLAGNKKEAFYTYLEAANCVYNDLDAMLDATFESLEYEIKNNGVKHIVLTGDLTTNGEYEGHVKLAEKLMAFEEKTGANIYVTPGNHDINNYRASTFINDKKEAAKITTPSDFYEIYKEFGFNEAYHQYTEFTAEIGGSLSYSIKTEDGYRLIIADGGKFTPDVTESGEAKQETAGKFTDELLQWILDEAEDAKKDGETPLLFTHWNMSGMNYFHEFLMQGFVIDNAYMLQEVLADAGINYTFSGHQHVSDISITYSDSGNPMYSVITPTLTQFPFSYRVTDFTENSEGGLSVKFNQRSCDEYSAVKAISGNGTYPSPYRTTGFFKQFGGHADASDYLFGILKNTLDKYINAIRAEGSIVKYIEKELNIDIEQTINSYLMGGIYLDGELVLSGKNVMNFLDDLDKQLLSEYIYQKSNTYEVVRNALDKLTSLQVSDVPCTKYIDTYGFGNTSKGGTLGDAVLSVIACMYYGNEDISDDPFLQDVVEFSGTTEFLDLLISAVKEYIVDDILINNILTNISFNFDTFFIGEAQSLMGYVNIFYAMLLAVLDSGIINASSKDEFIEALTDILTDFGDVSLKKLISAVLSTGLISYGTNTDELIDSLLDMFLTQETKEAAVYQAKIVIGGMVQDNTKDWDVTYVNNGPVKAEPTAEDMQLPVNITVTMTEDNTSAFTVNWFTKYSVTASDIEVVKKGESFTGVPITGDKVKTETKTVTYTAPGFDAGSFGILPWTRDIVQHTVTVYGLDTNTEYLFRIGDFEKGFTTDSHIKTAPDENGKFTFIHLSESGGTTPAHYGEPADVLKKADELYPDYSFAVHTGNLVSTPANDDQWSWAVIGAKDIFASRPFVYSAGTNDVEGEYSTGKYFPVTHAPDQLSDSGVYYSYDYGNAHFTVLNTNNKNSAGSLSKEQSTWLKEDLASSDKLWNILVMHESIYGTDTTTALHSQIAELMEDYDIDLILQGSEKIYIRTHLLNGDSVVETDTQYVDIDGEYYETYTDSKGTVAIISGSTSTVKAEEYPDNIIFNTVDTTKLPMFSAITIDGDTLRVTAHTVDGDNVGETDRFAIDKSQEALMLGDIDSDGKITASDARLALRYSVGLEKFSQKQRKAADVDLNNKITASDARKILRASVGLEKLSPAYIYM